MKNAFVSSATYAALCFLPADVWTKKRLTINEPILALWRFMAKVRKGSPWGSPWGSSELVINFAEI